MATKKTKTETSEEAQTTLTLADLRPAKGSVKPKLRVGRGRASGAGKTANRGHNGEGQRSGRSRKRGFEGGQMPGYRRMPKINGFQLVNPRNWLELNVGDLEQIQAIGESQITYELLQELGLLKNNHDGVRVLGNGDLKANVTVEAHYVTPSARQKIEAAGGTIKLAANAVAKEK